MPRLECIPVSVVKVVYEAICFVLFFKVHKELTKRYKSNHVNTIMVRKRKAPHCHAARPSRTKESTIIEKMNPNTKVHSLGLLGFVWMFYPGPDDIPSPCGGVKCATMSSTNRSWSSLTVAPTKVIVLLVVIVIGLTTVLRNQISLQSVYIVDANIRDHQETKRNTQKGVARNHASQENSTSSYELLQSCIDDYTSRGYWKKSKWEVSDINPACGFEQRNLTTDRDILVALQNLTIGFMGDSTTRSDIRAFEETFRWPRTNLDESLVFQKKREDGGYICEPWEQSVNLTKCGIPPIINTGNFRYFYKIYPWTPLDRWFFKDPELFRDLDVLVISIGRWLKFSALLNNEKEIVLDFEVFLKKLRTVYSGKILYQSEYPAHMVHIEHVKHPIANCTHGLLNEKYECAPTVTEERPLRDVAIRSLVERHRVLYLDRWNVSKTLPLDYYKIWLCGKPSFHSWSCDHHLYFVGMEHFRLLAHVVRSILF